MPVIGAREVLECLPELRSAPSRLILVTMFDEPCLVRELLALAPSAYLLKSASLEELLAAVHAAKAPKRRTTIRSSLSYRARCSKRSSATPRRPRAPGARDPAARHPGLEKPLDSNLLWVSETPVNRYVATLYPKPSVGSRGEATHKALSQGLNIRPRGDPNGRILPQRRSRNPYGGIAPVKRSRSPFTS